MVKQQIVIINKMCAARFVIVVVIIGVMMIFINSAHDISLPPIDDVTTEFLYDSKSQLESIYEMNTDPRGYCLIVNMKKDREGTDKDAEGLKKLFIRLKFKVKEYADLSFKEILKLADEVEQNDHSDMSSFVMFILAHGYTKNGETIIYAADEKPVSIPVIEQSIKNGLGLPGKPKLLFVQACRGGKEDHGVEHNATEFDSVKEEENDLMMNISSHSDFLTAYATVKGYIASRNRIYGTIFIQKLIETFENDANQLDVVSMLTKIKRDVVKESGGLGKQSPETTDTLRKTLYFGKPPTERSSNWAFCKDDCPPFSDDIEDDKLMGHTGIKQSTMDKKLDQKDLNDIMNDIKNIKTDYQKLGQYFRIQASEMKNIEYQFDRDPWRALNSVVTEWLKWNFDRNTKDGEYPTRGWLVKAVKEIDPQLAETLKKKYAKM